MPWWPISRPFRRFRDMILIGQYDSPFVRRVGIALRLYDITFVHWPWSAFGDIERLRVLNPLMRVPTLVLEDGFVLTDSHMMLDYLDGLMGERALFPRTEPARHRALKRASLATGLAEKTVSLFYERRLHDPVSPVWEGRLQAQITALGDAIEADLATSPGPYWRGDSLGHEDIALGCALRFLIDAMPDALDLAAHPHLASHSTRMEALPVFQAIHQPFYAPA
jgi:glutathione S-transferase